MNLKTQLRAKIRSKRAKCIPEKGERIICNIITILSTYQFSSIGLYYAIDSEPSLNQLLLLLQDKTFALPKVDGNQMTFCHYNIGDNLQATKFGVLQPLNNNVIVPDIVVVPGLAFDSRGYRLGHGLGFYDKYLATLNILKIGVCLNNNLLSVVPNELHDIKMDYVVTENLILKAC